MRYTALKHPSAKIAKEAKQVENAEIAEMRREHDVYLPTADELMKLSKMYGLDESFEAPTIAKKAKLHHLIEMAEELEHLAGVLRSGSSTLLREYSKEIEQLMKLLLTTKSHKP